MRRTMDPIEKAKIKARLQGIGLEGLRELSKVINLEIKQNYSLNDLAETIIANLEKEVIKKDNILNLIDYFEFADKIEHKIEHQTQDLSKPQLKDIVGIKSKTKDINYEKLIETLRIKIYKLEINTDDVIKKYNDFRLRNKLKKITNPGMCAYIASKLKDAKIDTISSEEFINLAIENVKLGKIRAEEIEELIKTARKELKVVNKRESKEKTLDKVQKEIETIKKDIAEIKKVLENLDSGRQIGYLRKYREKTGLNTGNFLKTFKMIIQKIESERENKFDDILNELKRSNIDLHEFIEQAMVVISLKQISELVSPMRFSITSEEFFNVLYEETNKIDFSSRKVIHKIRDAVTKRLEMSNKEFYKYLIECVKNGWIVLIEGSPVSGKEDDWLDLAGRRFYYLEFKRDINK